MIPEMPATGAFVARSASRMPGTAKMAPTDTTGLEGGSKIKSASEMASSTDWVGFAWSAPIITTAFAGTLAWCLIQYS